MSNGKQTIDGVIERYLQLSKPDAGGVKAGIEYLIASMAETARSGDNQTATEIAKFGYRLLKASGISDDVNAFANLGKQARVFCEHCRDIKAGADNTIVVFKCSQCKKLVCLDCARSGSGASRQCPYCGRKTHL